MKKRLLEVAFKVLEATELNLSDSRLRDAWLRELSDHIKVYYDDREKILTKLADKDEKGNPIVEAGHYRIQNLDEMSKEMEILLNETVKIEVTDKIKEIINKTNYKPKVGEMSLIDEILN